MEISSEVTSAIKKVEVSYGDYIDAKGEKVKDTAFKEHVNACLDAIDITSDGDFGEFGLIDFTIADKENKPITRINLVGLGENGDKERKLLLSMQDLETELKPTGFFLVEYERTDNGNVYSSWSLNTSSLPENKSGKTMIVNSLSQTVGTLTQAYLSRVETQKH